MPWTLSEEAKKELIWLLPRLVVSPYAACFFFFAVAVLMGGLYGPDMIGATWQHLPLRERLSVVLLMIISMVWAVTSLSAGRRARRILRALES